MFLDFWDRFFLDLLGLWELFHILFRDLLGLWSQCPAWHQKEEQGEGERLP